MTVGIPAQLVTSGAGVPRVCARHGEPAVVTKRVQFRSYTPGWVYLLVVLGVLLALIVAAAVQKRVKAPAWPFCARCRASRVKRLLVGSGTVLLAVLVTVVFGTVSPHGSRYGGVLTLGVILLVVVGLGIASRASASVIALGHVSKDGSTVEIGRAHPRFAEEAAAAQQWAVQQWAAQQGYVPAGQAPQAYAPGQVPPGDAPQAQRPVPMPQHDAALREQWGPDGPTRF